MDRSSFLAVCDLSHYGLGLRVLDLISDTAYFLGAKAPKLWIVRSDRPCALT